MGCTTSDLHSDEVMDLNDGLMLANAKVLQGIVYAAFSNDQLGLVVKLLNIQRLLKSRYEDLKDQRRRAARHQAFMTDAESRELEATAREEHRELSETYETLIKEYKALRSTGLFKNVSQALDEHCEAFEENRLLTMRLVGLKKQYRSALQGKQELDSLVLEVNAQHPLTLAEVELITRIACVTTYKFSSRNRALSYDTARMSQPRTRSSQIDSDSLRRVRRAIRRANRTGI